MQLHLVFLLFLARTSKCEWFSPRSLELICLKRVKKPAPEFPLPFQSVSRPAVVGGILLLFSVVRSLNAQPFYCLKRFGLALVHRWLRFSGTTTNAN